MQTEPVTESVAIEHEYIVDAEFAPRLSRAFTVFVLTKPATVVATIVLSVAGLALAVLGVLLGDAVFLGLGLLYLFLIPAFGLILYGRTVTANRRRLPIGSRIAIGLGATALRSEGPLGSSTASYRAYRRVFLRRGFVILRLQGLRVYSLLPVELFPGDDFDRLETAVRAANR